MVLSNIASHCSVKCSVWKTDEQSTQQDCHIIQFSWGMFQSMMCSKAKLLTNNLSVSLMTWTAKL